MNVVIDTSGWLEMVNELSRMSGRDFEAAVVLQVGALLKACIRKTGMRKPDEITRRVSAHNNYIEFADGSVISLWKKADALMFSDISNFDPKRNPNTPPPLVNKDGRTWHQMDGHRHWSATRWAKYQAFEALRPAVRAQKLADALAAAGLAKKTWWQIAEDLGLDASSVGASARVRAAHHPKAGKEGFARRFLEDASVFIEINNSNPIGRKLHGAEILERAMLARQRAYMIDLQLDVFNDMKRRAQRYPGIFTYSEN